MSEFRLATVAWSSYCFQYDDQCEFLRDVPVRATNRERSRLGVCCSAFMRKFVLRAVELLREDTETAGGGVGFAREDREYPIFQRDFAVFARHLTSALEATDLRVACGISYMRFYLA